MLMTQNERGQLSIFFGTTMIVVIGLIAFIINIGYFVKAKINLQNVVDAAAYSGASVQARQLTNIAYLNWEMRNVYKEWMFKYYVLGNLNTDAIKGNSTTQADFKMKSIGGGLTSAGTDQYNVPSICIDFSNTGDIGICRNYKIPGLPRFEAYNVQGMTQTTNAIIDAIVAEKAEDCSKRTALNYSTATLWAYNIAPKDGTSTSLVKDAPAIATDRQGAFPAAFELALRMRNLEAQVNKAPYTGGVCYQEGDFNQDFCSQTLEEVTSSKAVANERINKAFLSAWRNLGGSAPNDMLKASFTLKEISPRVPNLGSSYSLSNLLIPGDSPALQKRYLDLKLMTLNLAPFYTSFITQGDPTASVAKEAECAATKIGLPVPGYPLGFVKNANVLTYYAVKGEARFIGLFNPFDFKGKAGIKLTAVAAAKPFGGRVGPYLFNMKSNTETQILPFFQDGSPINVSSGYVLGLNKGGTTFKAGDPMPIGDFWQSGINQAIGGWFSSPENIRFTIPNLIYDYPTDYQSPPNQYLSPSDPIIVVNPGVSINVQNGLYNGEILNKFKSNISIGDGLTPDEINKGILSARAPTEYDLKNYLVPTPEKVNEEMEVNAYGFIHKGLGTPEGFATPNGNMFAYNYDIYAPVFSDDDDTLYKTIGDVMSVFDGYINNQIPSIEKYLSSMKLAAADVYKGNYSGSTNINLGQAASEIIANIPSSYIDDDDVTNPDAKVSCKSIAGKFTFFYTGKLDLVRNDDDTCTSLDNLPELLRTYWSNNTSELGEYYSSRFISKESLQDQYYNAYRPTDGPDSNASGQFTNKIRGSNTNMIRNYYSTKFITLNSVNGSGSGYGGNNAPIHANGNEVLNSQTNYQYEELSNAIDFDSVEFDSDKVNH